MSGLVIERPAASQEAPLGEGSAGFVKTAARLVRKLDQMGLLPFNIGPSDADPRR